MARGQICFFLPQIVRVPDVNLVNFKNLIIIFFFFVFLNALNVEILLFLLYCFTKQ